MLPGHVERSQSLEFFFATGKGKAFVHKRKNWLRVIAREPERRVRRPIHTAQNWSTLITNDLSPFRRDQPIGHHLFEFR